MKTRIIVCSFSTAIDDMKRKDQADIAKVLAVMDANPQKRFSAFEASANMTIARTMTRICHDGYVVTDNSCGYPWTKYTLTDKARAVIAKAHGEPQ